ncbi:MAG: shikimate dehydrogenase [Chromatiales bacterium]|nr:shikimate dehydrogenase [Chromatiales bacterium]
MREATSGRGFLIGLIGSGIGASRTPAMHEREGDALGVRYLYRRIDLDQLGLGADALPELLIAAERMGFDGLNVTHPCKQSVLPLLDSVSEHARALGAVNTVVLRDGRRVGHNTDCPGFVRGFRRTMDDAPRRRVVQLGAGGAGSAVAHALLELGTETLVVIDTDAGRAARLADDLGARFGAGRAHAASDVATALDGADGLVNATPVGMASHPGLPLPESLLGPALWVADIVYFPLETALLAAARARGCRTLDGSGMAVFQAVEAFELFTGLRPDPERMLATFTALGRPGG